MAKSKETDENVQVAEFNLNMEPANENGLNPELAEFITANEGSPNPDGENQAETGIFEPEAEIGIGVMSSEGMQADDEENQDFKEPDADALPDNTITGDADDAQNSASEDNSNTEPDEKPKRKRSSRKKAADDEENQGNEEVQAEDVTPEAETQAASAVPATRRRRRRGTPIVSIDEVRSVESEDDIQRSNLLDLVESLKGRKILTGTIQGVERSSDNVNISFAVIYHGDFKVIIPAEETVEPPEDFRDRIPGDVMHYLVTKRLGAEVDYIIKGVDEKTGIAAGSRLEAMAIKRKEYYFGTGRDGNNLLYEGITAEARIVSVIRAGIFVDLFGVEAYIPLRELSYQRWVDASQYYQPGQRVLTKILGIDRSDRNKILVEASVKQASENPYEKALKRYTVGSRYVGTVSIVDTNGVFVSLDGGIDCLCTYPKRGRPPRGSRVTVRILGINNENNRIWGVITHMNTTR